MQSTLHAPHGFRNATSATVAIAPPSGLFGALPGQRSGHHGRLRHGPMRLPCATAAPTGQRTLPQSDCPWVQRVPRTPVTGGCTKRTATPGWVAAPALDHAMRVRFVGFAAFNRWLFRGGHWPVDARGGTSHVCAIPVGIPIEFGRKGWWVQRKRPQKRSQDDQRHRASPCRTVQSRRRLHNKDDLVVNLPCGAGCAAFWWQGRGATSIGLKLGVCNACERRSR